ncbi:MAG TPA: hypothetical protein VFZ53_02515 [Polyangiaceae bacterium]
MTDRRAYRRARAALLPALVALGCQDGQLDVIRATEVGGGDLASPFVLDDFEDGDTQSLNIDKGYWYFQPDATCTGGFGVELVAGRNGNTHAVRARGGGCTEWGALLGLDLGGVGETLDASSFHELRLWARAEPNTFATITVSLLEPVHFDTTIELTGEWQEYVLPLDTFVFNDRGTAQPFDTNVLTHLQFFVFTDQAFDFWLDDLAFVRTD